MYDLRNAKIANFFCIFELVRDRKLLNIELGRISADEYTKAGTSGLVVVLDNVRSAFNVGSAFRTADAFRADKLVLCGICATPPSAEIHKSALGAEFSVPWEHRKDSLQAIRELREQGYTVVCAEQTEKAVKLNEFTALKGEKYALVFGNEVDGVQQCLVDEADFCVEIPQYGTKHSLNVSVSIGIVLWQFLCSKITCSV